MAVVRIDSYVVVEAMRGNKSRNTYSTIIKFSGLRNLHACYD
jgi:hypothetical protein